METLSLASRDKRCIWHPFTQMHTASLPISIASGKKAWLIGEDGKCYLDAYSSWWVNLHGHGHPDLIECLSKQAQKLEHVVFTDFTHEPAVELAEKLLQLLPAVYTKIFYSDNGSTAVETSLKMAIQFWHNQNATTKKTGIVCFKEAYHGDTFGAMAVAGKGTFNQPFWPFLFDVIVIDPPYVGKEKYSLMQLEQAASHYQLAGFIFEPHIQGVGGMQRHSLAGLDQMIAFCHQQGILTIADEVMTAFGRTGPLFVSQQLHHTPDILCVAKGLSGGMLPLAATICKEKIYQAFLSNERAKALLHGHTYYANPLACAVASVNVDLLKTEKCHQQRIDIEALHEAFCETWRGHPLIRRLEYTGTILALEYQNQQQSYFDSFSSRLKDFFLKKGILVRPMGNVLHVMPPYCIEEHELHFIYQVITETLENAV